MTTLGRSRRLGALLLVALGTLAVALTTSPAAALTTPPMVLRVGEVTTMNGGPLVGNTPISDAASWTPSGCFNPRTYCDTVPIKLDLPKDADPGDDFAVMMEVSWTPAQRADAAVTTVQANDLDTWVYDDRQISGTTSYTMITSGAGTEYPETLRWLAPTLRQYNLVIMNYSGVNTGYTVKATVIQAKFTSPFESLDPEFDGFGGGDDTSDEVFVPQDFSGDDAPSGDFSGSSFFGPELTGSSSILPTIDVVVDDDLDSIGSSTFNQDIQNPQSGLPVGSRTPTIPKKVPAIVLLFWLLVVPVMMVGGGFVLLWRRRRDSFSFAGVAAA